METANPTETNPVNEHTAKAARAEAIAATRSPLDRAFDRPSVRPDMSPPSVFDVPEPFSMPSISLDPGLITALPGYEELQNPTLVTVVSAMEAMHNATRQTIEGRNAYRSDMSLTEVAQLLATDELHATLQTPALRRVDTAQRNLDAAIAATEAQLRSSITTNSSYSAEIRAHFKGLTEGQRMQAINTAINSGDSVTLGAVIGNNVPPFLSGLDPAHVPALVQRANEVRNPQLTRQLKLLRTAQEKLQAAAKVFMTTADNMIGAKDATVRRLRQQKQKVTTVIGSIVRPAS